MPVQSNNVIYGARINVNFSTQYINRNEEEEVTGRLKRRESDEIHKSSCYHCIMRALCVNMPVCIVYMRGDGTVCPRATKKKNCYMMHAAILVRKVSEREV